jgi:[lysine-biosynthesis-protein LysW]--L-2-aminoadipate ligase
MRVGVLCSTVRVEEKAIFQALRARGVGFERIDVRKLCLKMSTVTPTDYDVIWIRCVSQSQAITSAALLRHQGVPTVNRYSVFEMCGDKVLTTLALAERGIPTPRTVLAFSQSAALSAIEEIGYPVVLKSPVGSWGRLLAKLNDREAAEAILEHKMVLHRSDAEPFYIQQYVRKPGRDIRTMVVGDETIYGIYRRSPHWITNTARGGDTVDIPITPEIDGLSRAAAQAVGGGIVAVDLLEDENGSLLVNEVNHTPEFHGAMQVAEIDIPGRMVDYVVGVCEGSI